MGYFLLHLRTATGVERAFGPVQFADLESAYLDVCSGIADTAADLLRTGRDPMCCAYLICDIDDLLLQEVPFAEVLRPTLDGSVDPAKAARAAARRSTLPARYVGERAGRDAD